MLTCRIFFLAPDLARSNNCLRSVYSAILKVYGIHLFSLPYKRGSLKLSPIGKCFMLLRSYDRLLSQLVLINLSVQLTIIVENKLVFKTNSA